MRKAINNRIMLSENEKKRLWENAVFVFDTNTLLDLYRIPRNSANSIIDAIDRISDRIWLPKQVALEFGKNRYGVIYDNADKFNINGKLVKARDEFINKCKAEVRDRDSIKKLADKIDGWIKKQQQDDKRIIDPYTDDLLDQILDLFDNKVGEGLSAEELSIIEKDGVVRYKNKIPPGYRDGAKNDNNEFGDLIIWKEIIQYSKENQKDILLVTQDAKDDWWHIVNGRTVGPRYELREEFWKETNQQIYFYSLNTFLEISSANDGVEIDPLIINELKPHHLLPNDYDACRDVVMNIFRYSYMHDIFHSVMDGSELSANDIKRILSYASINNSKNISSNEKGVIQGYLEGVLDVYNAVASVENDENVKKLEHQLLNSDEVRNALKILICQEC